MMLVLPMKPSDKSLGYCQMSLRDKRPLVSCRYSDRDLIAAGAFSL